MYLHKRGVEYYLLTFKSLQNELVVAKSNSNGKVSGGQALSYSGVNPTKYVEELLIHTTNIQQHISSEENVLKTLIDKTHQIIFGDLKKSVASPEFQQISNLVTNLDYLNEEFKDLHSVLEKFMLIIKEAKSNSEVSSDRFADLEYQICTILKNIEDQSKRAAQSMGALLKSIDKEKEFIKKEEETITDFNKNLMSWF